MCWQMNRKDKKIFVLKRRLVGLGLIGLCTTAGVIIPPIYALGLATSVLGICGVAMGVGILSKKSQIHRKNTKNVGNNLQWNWIVGLIRTLLIGYCGFAHQSYYVLSIMHYHRYFINLYMTCWFYTDWDEIKKHEINLYAKYI